MPAHKHRSKTMRQANKSKARNMDVKTQIKSLTKRVLSAETPEAAQKDLIAATSAIDKATKKGVLHKRTAARRVSRLAKKVNKPA
jgi:small subunit ribosomal protein S20